MTHKAKSLVYLALVIQFLAVSVYGITGNQRNLQFTQPAFAHTDLLERSTAKKDTPSVRTTDALVTATEIDSGVMVECSGVEDNRALAAAMTAAKGGWSVITKGRTGAAGTMTIPNLHIENGGLLKVGTGQTVTIGEKFDAGIYQTFANALPGQGTVTFTPNASLREIYPQWWGAKGDGTNDDTQA